MQAPKFNIRKIFIITSLASLVLGLALGYAMDGDLWNLPTPPASKVFWKDRSIELNGLSAPSVRFVSSLPASEIINFYKGIFLNKKWEMGEKNPDPGLTTFTKEGQFIYLLILPNSQDSTTKDVYIIKGSTSLAICYNLKDTFFQDKLTDDLPGKDMPDIMRYPGSKRRLNLSLPGQGTFLVYEAEAKPAEIANFYRRNLKASGWQEHPYFSQEATNKLPQETRDKIALLCLFRNKETLLVTVSNTVQVPGAKEMSGKRSLILMSRGNEQFAELGGEK